MKYKLLLPATMPAAGLAVLAGRDDVEIDTFPNDIAPEPFRARLADVHGVALGLTPFRAPEVAAARALKAVARIGVGYDTVDVDALTRTGVPLMIAGIANSVSVAEQALFFMFALAKRGAELHAAVTGNRWSSRFQNLPSDLFGKTVLVVGHGRVGMRMVKRCVALEMNVLVHDPYVKQDLARLAGAEPVGVLDEALGRADYVTIHTPKTPETIGMFDARRLSLMKPGACLVNTARGGIVDEAALHAALVEGRLAGAGLDVFDSEPPDPANPLLRLPNVLTAPHMAGVTREAFDRMACATTQNLLDVLDGRPLIEHTVNPEVFAPRA